MGPTRAGWIGLSAVLVATMSAARDTGSVTTVVRASWGGAPGQLGRLEAQESAPEGPMGFAVYADGDVYVLDQVNQRVSVFTPDGKLATVLPIRSDTFQAIALGPGGRVLLLDRLAGRRLRVLFPDGAFDRDVQLEGPGVPEGGGTTALLTTPEGTFVEVEHHHSVRLLDGRGQPDRARTVVLGRPLAGGRHTAMARRVPGGIELWTVDIKADVIAAQRTLTFPRPVDRIVTVTADTRGRVLCAVHWMVEDPTTGAVTDEGIRALLLDDKLRTLTEIDLPASEGPYEQFQELELGPDGSVYQLLFTAGGVEVRRWNP